MNFKDIRDIVIMVAVIFSMVGSVMIFNHPSKSIVVIIISISIFIVSIVSFWGSIDRIHERWYENEKEETVEQAKIDIKEARE